jgi:putative toxin-antitoxin system antitoxin component (TIGR02293 family)
MAPLEIHDQLVKGLPGEALFVSSAMAFDSMTEALALFDVSAKTAKQRIGERLSSSESEIALRIGRVWAMAADVFASLDAARNYLRTPNFALGGAVPRDLLKTAEGEQVVISELQTQAEGGPV